LEQKIAKRALKIKTREQRTIFFKLKRNVKINDESAKENLRVDFNFGE